MSNVYNKGGRPKKIEDEKISRFIKIGFTKRDREKIDSLANRLQMTTSKLMRDMYMSVIENGSFSVIIQSETKQELISILRTIGNNLNQIAAVANQSGLTERSAELVAKSHATLLEKIQIIENNLRTKQ